ncbi:MAG TPA: hypothetical protein VJC10_01635 [Patescibacteria group bacterium]|nr:hypothetical protein [Patescibacteria group bacterium]
MDLKKLLYFSKFPTGILALILLISLAIRVYNLNYNSPFLDEAQYIVLGQKVLAGHWQESNPFSWVGGMPLFYPTLSAIFGVFGIIGSRFFNVLLGVLSVYLIYEFTKSLRFSSNESEDKVTGFIAGSFLAILTVPIYLSRLAIYDMLSFTLFLLGIVFFIKGLTLLKPALWQRENRFSLAAIAFASSFLAKYIVLIFLPFIVFLGLWHIRREGMKQLKVYIKYFIIPLGIIVGGYIIWQFNALLHFQTEQISASESQSFNIARNFFTYSLPVLIPALVGSVLLFVNKHKIIPVILLGFALITPVIHIATNNLAASVQHTFLTIIFLLPLAAYAFLSILRRWRFVGSIFLIGILVGTLSYTYLQLRILEATWPNTNAVMGYLKKNTTNHEKVLSSQDDVTILALPNLNDKNITGIYMFEYKNRTGDDAYRLALNEDYFDFVLLNDHDHQEVEKAAREALTDHYKIVYDQTPFVVYKLSRK